MNYLTFPSPATGAVSPGLRQCVHKVLLGSPLSFPASIVLPLESKLPIVQEDPHRREGSLEFCVIPVGSGCVSGWTYATNEESERPLEAECSIGRTEEDRKEGFCIHVTIALPFSQASFSAP